MSSLPIFRVAPYSPSTSRITAHLNHAAHIHKYLSDQGMSVEPMVEAAGSVLLGYLGGDGPPRLVAEEETISFIADATPSMLRPLLQQWLDEHPADSPAPPEAES